MGLTRILDPIFILSGASPLSITKTLIGDILVLNAKGSLSGTTSPQTISLLVGATTVDTVAIRLSGGSAVSPFALEAKFTVAVAGTQSITVSTTGGTIGQLVIMATVYRH